MKWPSRHGRTLRKGSVGAAVLRLEEEVASAELAEWRWVLCRDHRENSDVKQASLQRVMSDTLPKLYPQDVSIDYHNCVTSKKSIWWHKLVAWQSIVGYC